MKHFVTYQLPAILWMLVIFLLSSRQRVGVSETYWINFAIFKTLHVIEYAFLYAMILRALASGKPVAKRKYMIALALTVLYAISDEMHQTFVPTREGTLRDVIIDSVGATTMMTVLQNNRFRFVRELLCKN